MNEFEYDRLGDYLEHIVQAIDRIDSYVEDMAEQAFTLDHRTQDAEHIRPKNNQWEYNQ